MSAHVISTVPPPANDRFRDRLQRELAARCGRNPRYSLRGYANFLGVDHATLSQILRGKRAVTPATIRRLGARIGLDQAEIDRYIANEAGAPERDAVPVEIRTLADDAARVFADWHPFAILELIRLQEFRPDVGWIERVLGIPGDAVQIALQHLVRLGFLRFETADRWVDLTGGAVRHEEDFTLLSLERLLARSRSLQAASAAIAPGDPRFHATTTIAVGAQDVATLVRLAERLLREAGATVRGAGHAATQLYQLEVHCFPISAAASEADPNPNPNPER